MVSIVSIETRTSLTWFQDALVAQFPELANSRFSLLTEGWDSVAVDVDDRWIFKFPRHAQAERALKREASLLAIVRPAVTMPVPDLSVISGPPFFSRHLKLKGEHLLTAEYANLPDRSRWGLAAELALFYAELHALDDETMSRAGADPIRTWLPPEEILRKTKPFLPSELFRLADQTIASWQQLAPDPHGRTYGFFDGHGWNMAFDHRNHRLNGIYDFADSGFGALHQELIYSSFISAELTARIVDEYERLTNRLLDRERIHLLTGVHRFSELAEEPDHTELMLRHIEQWRYSE